MDQNLTMLPALDSPGKVTSFYAYEGGPARNGLLAALALQLAADPAQAPVLVIDWDLEAPALHHYLEEPPGQDEDAPADPPGLAEYVAALRAELRRRGARPDAAEASAEALADAVLDAVDWRGHARRVGGRHPLYLMRAGRFDEGYAERVAGLDWVALFEACPALLRRFAARMARHFRHVLVASRGGRSATVSACTTLVPDRLVGLFTPAPGSLDGLEGAVRRAIEYRCTHEDEQRPLLVYPVACAADGARSDPGQRWRRGDLAGGLAGYQGRIEALLREAYGVKLLHLDSWFDEVQLPLCDAAAIGGPNPGPNAAGPNAGPGAGPLARPAGRLLSWFEQGHFPWHSPPECRLRMAIAQARAGEGRGAAIALAEHLAALAALCQAEGRKVEAGALLDECLALRRAMLGEDHPDARAALRRLAALHCALGQLDDARDEYEELVQACARSAGAEHPDTLAARSGLASVLGRLRKDERALALHEQVVATCERAWGEAHPATLDSVEALGVTLSEQHENERARVLFDRVLDGRRRLQGSEHEDTLRCAQRLAQLLGEMGELGNARRLLEGVLRARERYDGAWALPTLRTREALAGILAAQGDMAAVRSIQAAPARPREQEREQERELEPGHPGFESLQHQFAQLQDLIDRENRREARELADKLHHSVQWRTVALPLRKRVAAMIEQVYLQEGDKDAALAFNRNLVSSLEGALSQGGREGPPSLR